MKNKSLFKKRVGLEFIAILIRQLASLFKAGIPLARCINIAAEQTENQELKIALNEISGMIYQQGYTFSHSLSYFPKIFSTTFVAMIKTGERSGTLLSILENLANAYEKDLSLEKKVKSALIYPSIVFITSLLAVFVMLKFIFPAFIPIFTSFKVNLPLPTKILIYISEILTSPLVFILLLLVLTALIYLIYLYLTTPQGRYKFNKTIIELPILGNVVQKIALTKFSRALSLLHNSGVPIIEAIKIAKEVLENDFLKEKIDGVDGVVEKIKSGDMLSDSFTELNFPPIFVQMLRVGEETGELHKTLPKISHFYDIEIEYFLSDIASLIEPVIMIFLGVMVGFIILSIFLPLYSLLSGIGG